MEDYSPNIKRTITFLPKGLREYEFWMKMTEILDKSIAVPLQESKQITFKYTRPDEATEQSIKEIFNEMGWGYITELMDTLTDFNFNDILSFIAWVQTWKGSKKGLQFVLSLLGLDAIPIEWWESGKRPWTYDLIVYMDTSYVKDVELTIEKIRVFSRNYVYALLETVTYYFKSETFAKTNAIAAGWVSSQHFGRWVGQLYP